MAGAMQHFDDNNFDSGISKGVTLVDFYADWCGPCRMITPILEELSSEYQGRATVAKVNVDNAQNVSSKFNVTSIPTVILFMNGEEVKRVIGVRGKDTYKMMLDAAFVS